MNSTVEKILRARTTKQLVEDFITTGKMKMMPDLPTVRGWIMEELERRNPKAFNAWLDDEDCTDEALRKYF